MTSGIHIFRGGIFDENDPMFGKTPDPVVFHEQSWDFRCRLTHRLYEGRYDYDGTTRWEVARFLNSADAEIFLGLKKGTVLAVEACVMDGVIKRLNELDPTQILRRDGDIITVEYTK